MGKPAARIGDTHSCPMVNPNGTPHTGGPVIGPGCQTVLIEGQPAATVGDSCICAGEPDSIKVGSSGVYIGGKRAARQGDWCAHGGIVTSGCSTVLIGERKGVYFLRMPGLFDVDEGFKEPSKEEKIEIINQAIKDCILLLELRLELLEQNDPDTLMSFKTWFGLIDDRKKMVIKNRMQEQLNLFKKLTLRNFTRIPYEIEYRSTLGYVYSTDDSFTIYLGHPFWNAEVNGKDLKPGVLLHETSHFRSIGHTKDYGYYPDCESLAIDKPGKALYNADSYAFFLIGK